MVALRKWAGLLAVAAAVLRCTSFGEAAPATPAPAPGADAAPSGAAPDAASPSPSSTAPPAVLDASQSFCDALSPAPTFCADFDEP